MENIERYLRLLAVTGMTGKRWLEMVIALNETDDAASMLKLSGLSDEQIQQFHQL